MQVYQCAKCLEIYRNYVNATKIKELLYKYTNIRMQEKYTTLLLLGQIQDKPTVGGI